MSSTPTNAREQFDCDRDRAFLDTTVFAESVTYDSPKDSISGRSIFAHVQDRSAGNHHRYTIYVSDDDTTGIGAVPTRGATITLAAGDVLTVETYETNEGVHTLECVRHEAET